MEQQNNKTNFQLILVIVVAVLLFIGGMWLGSRNSSKNHFDTERELIKEERDSLNTLIKVNKEIDKVIVSRFDSLVQVRDVNFEKALKQIETNIRNLRIKRDEELRGINSNDSLYLRILARKQ